MEEEEEGWAEVTLSYSLHACGEFVRERGRGFVGLICSALIETEQFVSLGASPL